MVGPAEVTATATVLRQGRELLRALRQSNLADQHKAAVGETIEVVDDAMSRLFEIQAALVDLARENEQLQRKLAAAEQWDSRFGQYELFVTPVKGAVLRAKNPAPPHYACPQCAESEHQIHVLQYVNDWTGDYKCPACDVSYGVDPPRDPPRQRYAEV